MNILFVCSGNVCRSPLASALMHHRVAQFRREDASSPLPIQVRSAGTNASDGHPMSLAMEVILQEKGINPTHYSQRIHWDLIDWADLILTMTRAQKFLLISQVPELAAKLATLREYVGLTEQPDIDDPYGTDLNSYRQCAAEIEDACDRLLQLVRARYRDPKV